MGNAEIIRANLPCSVELPAGTGKTEVIAELVKSFASEDKRALVLTHTHAGVDVLRRRMKRFGVPRQAITIRTLDSWCFDIIGSFPDLAGIAVGEEPDWTLTQIYHEAGKRAVATGALVRMLEASYELLVVDEYQDCQLWQHDLVRKVSEVVPTCVLGDRMQGLFYFGDAQPVDWAADVEPAFPPIAVPIVPWRWVASNPALGEWLLRARTDLMNGAALDLVGSPVVLRPTQELSNVLFAQPRHPATTVAISQWPRNAAVLAQRLGGSYTMIEELEGRHLRTFASVLDSGTPSEVAFATFQYATECAFGLAAHVDMAKRRSLERGRPISTVGLAPHVVGAVELVNGLLTNPELGAVRAALLELGNISDFRLFRREAWFGMLDALRLCQADSELTSLQAVVTIRNKLRFTGRRPESRIVGRPLLIKGLEFDHAVITEPERMNAHELYVCLTRGSHSVTLISDQSVFQPQRPQRS